MIELTASDGTRLFVNPSAIWHIRSNGATSCAIYAASGAALFVQGAADEVAKRVADAANGMSQPSQ